MGAAWLSLSGLPRDWSTAAMAIARGITQAQEDTLLSVLAEADRAVRDVPTAEIRIDYVRQLLTEGLAQLPEEEGAKR